MTNTHAHLPPARDSAGCEAAGWDAAREPVGQRIRAARLRAGLSLQELADRTRCAKSYLSAVETGRRNAPTDPVLVRIEAALALPAGSLVRAAHWQRTLSVGGEPVRRDLEAAQRQQHAARRLAQLLMTHRLANGHGADSMLHGSPPSPLSHPLDALYRSGELQRLVAELSPDATLADPQDPHKVAEDPGPDDSIPRAKPLPREVPLINSVAAGYPRTFTDLGYPARVADEYVRCPDLDDPDAFAARVVGDSMQPAYVEGDVVIFSPAKPIVSGQDCFARTSPDHETTFKRVYFEAGPRGEERIRLQPLNHAYPPRVLRREEVVGLYAAAQVIRRVV